MLPHIRLEQNAMNRFIERFTWSIGAVLGCFDRVLFKGYLPIRGGTRGRERTDIPLSIGSRPLSPFSDVTLEYPDTLGDRYRYQGNAVDVGSGLQYAQGRWYDPTVGRWVSEDPNGLAGGDINLYRFNYNNPYRPADDAAVYFGAVEPEAGTAQWLYGGRAFWGTTTAGSVGLRSSGVDGESVGETLIGGFGQMLGQVSWADRERNARTSAARADVALGQLGPDLAEGAQQFAENMRDQLLITALTGGVGMMAGPGMTVGGAVATTAGTTAVGAGAGFAWGGLNGQGDWDWDKAWAGAATGAMIGAGVGLHMAGGCLGMSMASGALLGGGLGGLPALLNIGESVNWTQWTEGTLMGGAMGAGYGMMAGWDACFPGESELLTRDGFKRIDQFRRGDWLLSRRETDPLGALAEKQVEEVFVRWGRIWHLHVGGRVLRTTGEHPFFAARAWAFVPARQLRTGDGLLTPDGRWVTVEKVYDTGKYETVYNLRVADYHTYFVGSAEWGFSVWAHNAYREFSNTLRKRGVDRETINEAFWMIRAGNAEEARGLLQAALRNGKRSDVAIDRMVNRALSQVDSLSRPSTWRAGFVETIEAQMLTPTGMPQIYDLDPNGRVFLRERLPGEYGEMGHIPGMEHRRLVQDNAWMTQREFNQLLHDHPEWFRIETRRLAASHIGEL
jgi:RHS repeat-associated protein